MGKLKKLVSLITCLFCFSSPLWAPINSRLNIQTQDGTVNNWPYKLKCSNGSLVDNGDGTMTLTVEDTIGNTTGLINLGINGSLAYYSVYGSSNVINGSPFASVWTSSMSN